MTRYSIDLYQKFNFFFSESSVCETGHVRSMTKNTKYNDIFVTLKLLLPGPGSAIISTDTGTDLCLIIKLVYNVLIFITLLT